MFDNLSDKLSLVFKKVRGHGKLNEKNIQEALREVRMALLEADVHFAVAKKFCQRIGEKAVGQEILSSLTASQQVIKIMFRQALYVACIIFQPASKASRTYSSDS